MFRKSIALMLGFNTLVSPAFSYAATIPGFPGSVPLPSLATNTLPVVSGTSWQGVQSITSAPGSNLLVINQNQPQAIINWNSFNIGATAAVRFNQGTGTPGTANWKPDSSYVALNRIFDQNPTLIYGKLSADGKVYLINRNGILFGPNSQVNVSALVASALNITDANFTKGLLGFTSADYTGTGSTLGSAVAVTNLGNITTSNGGFAALVAPQAVNGGTITSPVGKIALIGVGQSALGADAVDLEFIPNALSTAYDSVFNAGAVPGVATNAATGSLLADSGRIDMIGATVNQNGLVRAISTVQTVGVVNLLATDQVTTGATSLTATPVSDSQEKVSQTFQYQGGSITLGGIYTSPDGTTLTPVSAQPLKNIVHNGDIEAPSGTVNLNSVQQVYLESGSTINVAGLWVDEAASANQVSAQLNSVQLADDYNQKNGVLQGQTVSTTLVNGSSIGSISGSYTAADLTAQERSTVGGEILIAAPGLAIPGGTSNYTLASFVAKSGSTLDFGGGGYRYAAGTMSGSVLVSGTTAYDISKAPETLTYQQVLGDQTSTSAKFGVTKDYSGLYLGGGTALNQLAPASVSGSNAGGLSVQARVVALDGNLNGSVTRGTYQTQTTSPTSNSGSDYAISVARGLEAPVGGTLTIGSEPGSASQSTLVLDSVTNAIEVTAAGTPLPAAFGPGDQPVSQVTVLSAALLSGAGLSQLNLLANNSVTIDSGAHISLAPSGSYLNSTGTTVYLGGVNVKARSIVDRGTIDVPGGSVQLTIQDNISSWAEDPNVSGAANPLYQPVTSGILIDSGARVNVAGESIDNSISGGTYQGQINGGAIAIQDLTVQGTEAGNPVIVRSGAQLNVDGGYRISASGALTGGNAGSLTLKGATLSLAGELDGFSLPGKSGGTLTLHAGDVEVTSQGVALPDTFALGDAIPVSLQGKLLLGGNQLSSTGFTQITLEAIHDVVIDGGVTLAPSTVKSTTPIPGGGGSALSNSSLPAQVGGMPSSDYTGATSIRLLAGQNIYTGSDINGSTIYPDYSAQILIPQGAGVAVVPGGAITLSAPGVALGGTLQALGGTVSVTASFADLVLESGAQILAGGYNKPGSATVAGVAAGPTPEAGGSVTLSSTNGNLTLDNGSLVDVSGSPAVQVLTAGADGTPVAVTLAGNPGSLSLNFGGKLTLSGELNAQAGLVGVQGGTLTVSASAGDLTVAAADFDQYQKSGFDAITLRSVSALDFQGSLDVTVGRSLTLDAPLITGNNSQIQLNSPWIQLTNTSFSPTSTSAAAGGADTAQLALSGGFLDVTGSVKLSGFSSVLASASADIRLTDSNYTRGVAGTYNYQGSLTTDQDLTLQAARIYPTTLTGTLSNPFAISAGGTVTVLPGAVANSAPIYSAGGNLSITAGKGIDVEGGSVLAAPLGSISLNADPATGRVYLASGSLVSTSSSALVNYGSFDGSNWYGKDLGGGSADTLITGQPAKSISISGNQVVVMAGAELDVAGGGTVFSYLYQPDVQGTTNPISTVGISALTGLQSRANYYVILPDNSVQIPGFSYTGANGKTQTAGAVYLSGIKLDDGSYLKAGTYSLLPAEFAFLPGALVISDLGKTVSPGASLRTAEGYQEVGGYATVLNTGITSAVLEGYSVRSAAALLQEGNFTVKQFTAGDAGSLSITGNSTVMAGSFNAAALTGYTAGSLTLSGTSVSVQNTVADLPGGFGFTTPLPAAFTNQLQVATAALTGQGLGTLTLGDAGTTNLTVAPGTVLDVPNIILNASQSLTIGSGAQLNGISQTSGGTVTLSSPTGTVTIESNAVVHASGSVSLNVNDLNLQGALQIDNGSLNLTGSEIFFVPDGFTKSAPGIYLTQALLQGFSNYHQVSLTSRSDLNFLSDLNLTLAGNLVLDANRYTGPASVVFNAKTIELLNSAKLAANPQQLLDSASGSLTLNAGALTVSLDSATAPGSNVYGDILFNGFNSVNLNSSGDLTLSGVGALKTTGNLNLSAARVTTSYYSNAATPYLAANFLIDTTPGNGTISITKSGGAAGSSSVPGGTLALIGKSINQSGVIEVASGQVLLTATGSGANDGVFLSDGAQILARGTKQATADPNSFDYYPGGQIALTSSNGGSVNLAAGSALDVSAAAQGDAGSIALSAPLGGVTLNGTLLGGAGNGRGGSFTLDTKSADLTALSAQLSAGGFTQTVAVRARQGDLTLAQGQTLSANSISLEADGSDAKGAITIDGILNALTDSSGNGGSVELDAQNALTVNGVIRATGTVGGTLFLGSENGMVTQNGLLNVSGTGTGGSVSFRAQQTGPGMDLTLPGQIQGASQVVAEAFKVYSNSGDYTVGSQEISQWMSDAASFSAGALLPAGWGSASGTLYHLRPGIEVRSSGDLTLASNLDLTPVLFNGEPGVLTLRAGGNLNIDANLVDHPTSYATLYSSSMQQSWAFNLAAGSDLSAASPLAVNAVPAAASSGSLTIAAGDLVYTEDGLIRFASAGNTNISMGKAAGYMITAATFGTDPLTKNEILPMSYSLSSYGGNIQGTVGHDLVFTSGGAIQTATGNISLKIGGDLDLYDSADKTLGAIRTTGEYAQGTRVAEVPGSTVLTAVRINDYWTYHGGGSIKLDVAGSVAGTANNYATSGSTGLSNGWDWTYGGGTPASARDMYLAASFQGADSTQGIATMGGGDILVRSGGSFDSQIGAFGTSNTGNLVVAAGGNLLGRFRVMDGTATLLSGGNFGDLNDPQVIELAKGQVSVAAMGSVYLGTVLNPDNSRNNLFKGNKDGKWNLSYGYASAAVAGSADSSVALSAVTGNLRYLGISSFDGYPSEDSGKIAFSIRQTILPASVSLNAAGDIDLMNDLYLAPSPTGNLELYAGGSIDGTNSTRYFSKIYMYDQSPASFYGYKGSTLTPDYNGDAILEKTLVHAGDANPVQIAAGKNIENLQLFLTKEAEISAGQDIKQIVYVGENLNATDVTTISAGRDIDYIYNSTSAPSLPVLDPTQNYGIMQGGPGTLVVEAGRNIDLGNSGGIQSVANFYSPYLSSTGSDVIVAVGAKNAQLQPDAVGSFFSAIVSAGDDYSSLLAAGETAQAQQVIAQVQSSTISKLFSAPPLDGSGSLSMTQSQISTLGGKSDISILVAGSLNVGTSTLSSSPSLGGTGIYTGGGGAINIFTGESANVNESRVMTFLGGDITVWSDQGSINAGRGSKTTVSAASPHLDPLTNVVTFTPPAVGSGIRAVTYDPNTVPGGPLPIPDPGNINLFAPKGVIDAGEAGIAGGKVILGATEVLNAKNISFSAGSVGVPASSDSNVSMGSLSGAGSVAENSKMIEQSSSIGATRDKSNQQAEVVDDFMSKWLDLRIISFDGDDSADDGTVKDKDKKKK